MSPNPTCSLLGEFIVQAGGGILPVLGPRVPELVLSRFGREAEGAHLTQPDPHARTARLMDYRCLRNTRPSNPYNFDGFGARDVTKPYESIWFGDLYGPKNL
jgi:hypothetical protein